jgi:hypothetical protein
MQKLQFSINVTALSLILIRVYIPSHSHEGTKCMKNIYKYIIPIKCKVDESCPCQHNNTHEDTKLTNYV